MYYLKETLLQLGKEQSVPNNITISVWNNIVKLLLQLGIIEY
jgi:hypothetical protein